MEENLTKKGNLIFKKNNNKLEIRKVKNKEKTINILHIMIIVISTILMGIGIFNKNIWFDEAYSYGLTNQSIIELIKIAIYDVHPLLYYIILKIFVTIFGKSMIAYRAFSIIPLVIMMIFSLFKIRKEFGYKVACIFSFTLGFLPIIVRYSTEIRMYTWAMLFIMLTSFYGYMALKEKNKKTNYILFSIFSVMAAYTHHYALFTICAINIYMLFYIVKNIKISKNYKIKFKDCIDSSIFKNWIKYGIIQLLLFIPGLLIFLKQSFQVAGGFWITVKYPKILLEVVESSFKGEIENILPFVFAILIVIYTVIKLINFKKIEKKSSKNVQNEEANQNEKMVYTLVMNALVPYVLVIIFALVVSVFRPIFITRYMIPMLPLLIFALSVIISNEKNKTILVIFIVGILVFYTSNQIIVYNKNYNVQNYALKEEMKDLIKKDDIFIFSEIGAGSVIGVYFPDNQGYFYNIEKWDVEEAYKAFLPQIITIRKLNQVENLNDENTRIWLIDTENSNLRNEIGIENKEITIYEKEIYNPYSNTTYFFTLYE